jgi:hypothetical protein
MPVYGPFVLTDVAEGRDKLEAAREMARSALARIQ